MSEKPIRVFYNTLSERFYASRAYKDDGKGKIIITGKKFDVTSDIGAAIEQHGITFESVDDE